MKRLKNKTKWIAIIISGLGFIGLSCEIYNFLTLPTAAQLNARLLGLTDYYRYKEETYCQLLSSAVVLGAGLSYWLNKKVFWTLCFSVTSMAIYAGIYFYISGFNDPHTIWEHLILVVYFALFAFLHIKLWRMKEVVSIPITRENKIVGLLLGIVLAVAYWLLAVCFQRL